MRKSVGWIKYGLAATAIVLVGASCSSGAKNASPTATTPTTVANAVPVTASNGPQVIPGTATGKSACEKALPNPASPGQVGAGTGGSNQNASPAQVAESEHGERGMVVQASLTHMQRSQLESQMEAARQVALRYPTVKEAVAAGYHESTVYVPCIGAHYTNFGLVTAPFDPAKPSELLYDGTSPDSKIVGLSYLLFHPGGAPPGFAGPNDHWHQHNANGGLCLKGGLVVGSEALTREQCAARGGRKTLLTDVWMVHAWIVPGFECTWGTFSGECPELGGRLCGTAWDAPAPQSATEPDTCPKV
ncbi:MAG TPA: hypothetical protein VFR41_02980 [Acidimicrobiia bacterium]|nr:hypothetical protein [Acidimicrobiia bacterium]